LKFPRTWVPLASAYELDPQRPNEVWFLGKSYVVYQNQKQSSSYSSWIVVDGTCPHRLAPLSEGRIDPITQHLECSYHGWTFDANGTCIRIPQASVETERLAFANPRCHITSYPVWIEKNVLFFWPWSNTIDPLSVIHQPYTQPEHMLQYVRPNCSTYTRDLP
jgi:pheophorbide a oxygenase